MVKIRLPITRVTNSFLRFFVFLVFGVFPLVLSNCTTIPESQTQLVPVEASEDIINTLQAREAQVVSLKGLFQAEVDGEGMAFAQSFQGSILYQRPDQYRIKGFTQFGGLVFDFVLSGGFYALRVQNQPSPIMGGMDNFQRLGDLQLPVLLSLRAIDVVLGKLPLPLGRTATMQQRGDTFLLEIPSDPQDSYLMQRLLIEQRSLQIRQLDYINPEGKSIVSVQTSDFRRVRDGSLVETNTIQLPFTVSAEDNVRGGNIGLEFLEIVANASLDKRQFTLTAF